MVIELTGVLELLRKHRPKKPKSRSGFGWPRNDWTSMRKVGGRWGSLSRSVALAHGSSRGRRHHKPDAKCEVTFADTVS